MQVRGVHKGKVGKVGKCPTAGLPPSAIKFTTLGAQFIKMPKGAEGARRGPVHMYTLLLKVDCLTLLASSRNLQ